MGGGGGRIAMISDWLFLTLLLALLVCACGEEGGGAEAGPSWRWTTLVVLARGVWRGGGTVWPPLVLRCTRDLQVSIDGSCH